MAAARVCVVLGADTHDILEGSLQMPGTDRERLRQTLEGHGFTPWSPEKAKERAEKRVELGYVKLYPAFADRARS